MRFVPDENTALWLEDFIPDSENFDWDKEIFKRTSSTEYHLTKLNPYFGNWSISLPEKSSNPFTTNGGV